MTSKRERIEDLGYLCAKLEALSDHEMFEERFWGRPKDACDWFGEQTDEKKDDVIHNLAYWIQDIDDKLAEMVVIARGHHDLGDCE